MTVLIAILLGIVQGLCEFLPISSSGHLVLLQRIFGIEEGALFFTIMLHIGTLFAVFSVYYKDIWELLKAPFQKRVGMLILALVPTVVMALLFNDVISSSFDGRLLGFGFIITALLLLVCDKIREGKATQNTMRIHNALLIGLMQGVALFPGISRSGSTITGGLISGMERKSVADFTFILSIPAILGSIVLEVPSLIKAGLGEINWLSVIAGMIAAAVSGYIAIRLMLRVLKKKRFIHFAAYTGVLGLLIVLDQFVTHIFI